MADNSKAALPGGQVVIDDCKDDGWRLFLVPTFRNQGECVSSFVP